MVETESMGHCRVSAFRGGLVLTSVESGSGCYNCVAENVTESTTSNAWHFVVNLIYLHISCATAQTNQWAESWNHFLRPSSNWYQEVRIEKNHSFRSIWMWPLEKQFFFFWLFAFLIRELLKIRRKSQWVRATTLAELLLAVPFGVLQGTSLLLKLAWI